MLGGCPTGFLTKELTILVQRSIIEVCEQLTKLEPKAPEYLQELELFTSALTETQRLPPVKEKTELTDPKQMKEVKHCLEEVQRFVVSLENLNRLNRSQANAYRAQIKQLVLQLAVDGYVLNARGAKDSKKFKLALHYYDSAEKLMVREGKPGLFEEKVAEIRATMEKVEALLVESEALELPTPGNDTDEELEDEWNKFDEEDGRWHKKQVYD